MKRAIQIRVIEFTEELHYVHRRELNASVHSLRADFNAHRREMDSIAGSTYLTDVLNQSLFVDRVKQWAERDSELRTRVNALARVVKARLKRASELRGKLISHPLDSRRLLDELLEEVRIQEGGLAKIESLSSELRRLNNRAREMRACRELCAVEKEAAGRSRIGAELTVQHLDASSRLASEFLTEMFLC